MPTLGLSSLRLVVVVVKDAKRAEKHDAKFVGQLVLVDPAEKELARGLAYGDLAAVRKTLVAGLAKHDPPIVWAETFAEARVAAKASGRRIVVLMEDPAKAALVEDPSLEKLARRFCWARVPYVPNSLDAAELGASGAGELLAFDKRPLGTDGGAKTLAEVKAFLESILPADKEEKK